MNEVKKPKQPLIFYYLLAVVAIILFNSLIAPMLFSPKVTEVDYSEFMRMTEDKQVKEVMVEDNQILFTDGNGSFFKTGLMDDKDLTQRLYASGAKFSSQIVEQMSPLLSLLISWVLPLIVMIALGQLVSKKLLEKAGGGAGSMMFGMGKSNAKIYVKSTSGIKFDDVAGEDEAKEILSEIVDFLHNPDRREDAQGRAAGGPSRHGQDAAGEGRGRRGQRALLLDLRL